MMTVRAGGGLSGMGYQRTVMQLASSRIAFTSLIFKSAMIDLTKVVTNVNEGEGGRGGQQQDANVVTLRCTRRFGYKPMLKQLMRAGSDLSSSDACPIGIP
jgi:hypothetical protein